MGGSGVIVIHKCVAIRHAETAARMGADMISMDGFDCGGHPGEEDVGNWVLLARAGKVLKIPFVASGGNVTGSQLAAAMAMGAEGVNMGTAFMATQEAPVHDGIKQALVQATERDTTHVFRTLNNTERVFKNKTAMEVREIEADHPGDFSKLLISLLGQITVCLSKRPAMPLPPCGHAGNPLVSSMVCRHARTSLKVLWQKLRTSSRTGCSRNCESVWDRHEQVAVETLKFFQGILSEDGMPIYISKQ